MTGKAEDVNKSLLDKDWGAKIPDYITKGTFSLAVFLMSLTMRGVFAAGDICLNDEQKEKIPGNFRVDYNNLDRGGVQG